MALEQDSGYCLTGDTENNLETKNNITLHLGDGDIVTSLDHFKESVKGEKNDFVISRSAEQDVNTEASGHTDKDDCENDAVNFYTFESQKENTSESETENLLNSVDDATPLRDAASSDPDLTESANLAIPESESESVQKIKDHCNKGREQVSPENDDAHNTKEDLNKTENIHTLSKVSSAVKNISNIGEENETETNTFADSLKPHELDDKSGTSYSLSDAVDSLCTAVSNLENWIGMDKVGEENEEHVKNCKIGEDENISRTDSVLPVIKENKEECKQSLDISLWKPVDERFQNKKEKKYGLINSKQPLNQSKRKTAVFLNKSKESSTIFQQTPSDVSQNKSTSISLDRYSDIMERINQMVMPLHNELFPGRSTQTLRQYSSTQTSPVSQNNSLLYPETTPTAKEHSNTQRSPNKTRSLKSSGKCLIHSIPKLIMCLDCKQKRCPQCILVDGTCRGHTLAEAPHLAIQREKVNAVEQIP